MEVVMFPGRSVATKKAFLRRLFADAQDRLDLAPADLEVVLLEPPRHDWGIRGLLGDELDLTYRLDV
ncbi:tautomerase family protein [Kineococcus sp. LSe6-4]|uniref:Tautomerase family protein n=1 Tax=Kineococcus halophytocola TaxID=3234027 RepID=A0ABV4H210_9ACTN